MSNGMFIPCNGVKISLNRITPSGLNARYGCNEISTARSTVSLRSWNVVVLLAQVLIHLHVSPSLTHHPDGRTLDALAANRPKHQRIDTARVTARARDDATRGGSRGETASVGAIARVAETRAGGEARGGGDTGHGENVRARVDVNGRARESRRRGVNDETIDRSVMMWITESRKR